MTCSRYFLGLLLAIFFGVLISTGANPESRTSRYFKFIRRQSMIGILTQKRGLCTNCTKNEFGTEDVIVPTLALCGLVCVAVCLCCVASCKFDVKAIFSNSRKSAQNIKKKPPQDAVNKSILVRRNTAPQAVGNGTAEDTRNKTLRGVTFVNIPHIINSPNRP